MKANIISNEKIIIHWWNFRKKSFDFSGTISECLKAKGIKVTQRNNKRFKDEKMFTFQFEISSRYITFSCLNPTFSDAAIEAIKLFLTVLGDKSLITGYRTVQINF